ncbi:MAG: hypothetical protein AAGA65_06515 [Actinomycetota bacterium]
MTTTQPRWTRRPFVAVLLAAALFVGVAATESDEEVEPEDQTEVQLPELDRAALDAIPVAVVDRDARCPAELVPEPEPVQITRYDAICVGDTSGAPVVAGGDLQNDEPGSNRLVVDPAFDWAGNTPRVPLSFEITAADEIRTVAVTLSPDLGIDIRFAEVPDVRTATATSDDGEAPASTTTTVPAGPEIAVVGEGPGGAPVTIGQSRRSKSIVVTGRDRDIDGFQIREQVRTDRLRLIAEVDGAETVLMPELDGDRVNLELVDGSVTYDLALAEGANFGSAALTQETELLLGSDVLAFEITNLALEAPSARVDVQALAQVVGGDDTLVSVRVTNQGGTPITGPLDITLRPIEGEGLVAGFDDVSDGSIDGNVVTWPIAGDLAPGDQVVQTIQVDLSAGSAESQIRWEGTLTRQGATAPIDSATVTTDITQEGSGSEAGVQFTPDQLIRLIAFVMAFALVAVIFGAWNRGSRERNGDHSEDHHKHELEMFRAYTEAILVLVILVAILVLALRGSLSGESAASLIGVIAGYALGRSTSGR